MDVPLPPSSDDLFATLARTLGVPEPAIWFALLVVIIGSYVKTAHGATRLGKALSGTLQNIDAGSPLSRGLEAVLIGLTMIIWIIGLICWGQIIGAEVLNLNPKDAAYALNDWARGAALVGVGVNLLLFVDGLLGTRAAALPVVVALAPLVPATAFVLVLSGAASLFFLLAAAIGLIFGGPGALTSGEGGEFFGSTDVWSVVAIAFASGLWLWSCLVLWSLTFGERSRRT